MRDFIISTDSTADLPKSYFDDNNILLHPLHYIIDGKEYGADILELTLTEFYKSMRNGKMATTSATNPGYYEIRGLLLGKYCKSNHCFM